MSICIGVEPSFCGKVHVIAVKNNKWFWYDYKTSAKNDKKILELIKDICPKEYTWERQPISKEKGELFCSIIEKAIDGKLDIPENASYSVTHSSNYNPVKKRDLHSILLFCQEKFVNNKSYTGDRTAIDIFI